MLLWAGMDERVTGTSEQKPSLAGASVYGDLSQRVWSYPVSSKVCAEGES